MIIYFIDGKWNKTIASTEEVDIMNNIKLSQDFYISSNLGQATQLDPFFINKYNVLWYNELYIFTNNHRKDQYG